MQLRKLFNTLAVAGSIALLPSVAHGFEGGSGAHSSSDDYALLNAYDSRFDDNTCWVVLGLFVSSPLYVGLAADLVSDIRQRKRRSPHQPARQP